LQSGHVNSIESLPLSILAGLVSNRDGITFLSKSYFDAIKCTSSENQWGAFGEITIRCQVTYYDYQPLKSEEGRKISNAHPRILELMGKIFDVNFGDELDLSEWETMWTTRISDYLLVTSSYDDHYSIFYLPTTGDVTIEDDDLYFAIVEKMKAAGVRIVNSDYLKRFMK
jgi:hypothetical protein